MLKNHIKLLYLSLICFAFATLAKAEPSGTFDAPKYEARAVWITTIGGLDWPHNYARDTNTIDRQKKELCQILDQLKAANV
ncbi:MAG: hypothetical protein Q4F34_05490, partial [Prevotellaceae bacterium]|nr:hypothetical protein [Prevotellaceae bacterium]